MLIAFVLMIAGFVGGYYWRDFYGLLMALVECDIRREEESAGDCR